MGGGCLLGLHVGPLKTLPSGCGSLALEDLAKGLVLSSSVFSATVSPSTTSMPSCRPSPLTTVSMPSVVAEPDVNPVGKPVSLSLTQSRPRSVRALGFTRLTGTTLVAGGPLRGPCPWRTSPRGRRAAGPDGPAAAALAGPAGLRLGSVLGGALRRTRFPQARRPTRAPPRPKAPPCTSRAVGRHPRQSRLPAQGRVGHHQHVMILLDLELHVGRQVRQELQVGIVGLDHDRVGDHVLVHLRVVADLPTLPRKVSFG